MDESTASFLDKTDWRITIHRKLEDCVDSKGTEEFPQKVESLISAVAVNYPGWNAKDIILREIDTIRKKFGFTWDYWLEHNRTKRRWQKEKKKKAYYMSMYNEIFELIKNQCGEKRMLLWGHKKIGGGTQMEYTD